MSEFNISIEAGKTKVLHTAGKYCDRDIVVTAEGGIVDDRYDEGYNAGFSNGAEFGYAEGEHDGWHRGIEQGKQAEYDAFWDAYQQNGNRTDYGYAFAGWGWTDALFKPKYDIKPMSISRLFESTAITDVVKLLNDAGVVLDTSNLVSCTYIVSGSERIQTLPPLNITKLSNLTYFIFNCSNLRSIGTITLKNDGSQSFAYYSFGILPKLEEIRFEGCIGKSMEIKESPLLSTESVNSIINCLKDLTGATAQTLTLHATVGGKLTDEQKAAISAKNWTLVY